MSSVSVSSENKDVELKGGGASSLNVGGKLYASTKCSYIYINIYDFHFLLVKHFVISGIN